MLPSISATTSRIALAAAGSAAASFWRTAADARSTSLRTSWRRLYCNELARLLKEQDNPRDARYEVHRIAPAITAAADPKLLNRVANEQSVPELAKGGELRVTPAMTPLSERIAKSLAHRVERNDELLVACIVVAEDAVDQTPPNADLAEIAINELLSKDVQIAVARRGAGTSHVEAAREVAATDAEWARTYPHTDEQFRAMLYFPYEAYFKDWDRIKKTWEQDVLRKS